MSSEKSYTGWYFLIAVVLFYVIVGLFRPDAFLPSLEFSLNIIKNIIPVFVLIFGIMAAFNYFLGPRDVSRYLGDSSGLKRWLIAIFGGIASTGPIYMWYPMLKDLKKKGVGYGFIATFLYNRAIKIPLIPMLLFYFGLEYTLVLTVVMIIFSIIQGLIFEEIERGGFI
jgi:uncharacterized membrane protein YraQ (UPF0718 family)